MRKIGLIGGMSWASTELYYRHLNKGVQKRVGTGCSAPILLESLNYCELSRLTTEEQWAHARDVLIESAKRLEDGGATALMIRSEEHTSELQSLMRISYAVFCLKKKKK